MSSQSGDAIEVKSLLDTKGIEPIGSSYPTSYSHFIRFTEHFSDENFIGNTQFALLYRGKIPCGGSNQTEDRKVTVKLWVKEGEDDCEPEYQKQRLEDEICFLKHPSVDNHPNLAPLIGYFAKGLRFGVIYDLNPIDTLQNLIVKDTFSWTQRIKVAIALARLLGFLHSCEPPYKVCNLAAAHILVDQDFNPRLVDFGMLSGGILGDRPNPRDRMMFGAYGYIDLEYSTYGLDNPGKRDVFAYGVLLLNLIAKRVVTKERPWEPQVHRWATSQYEQLGFGSLVHESLKSESMYVATVGLAMAMVAMRCVNSVQNNRPAMSDIVNFFQEHLVTGSHGEVIGVKKKQRMRDAQSVGSLPKTL